MTRADELRQRAREVEDHAEGVRWLISHEQYKAMIRLSRELAELADHLPPERVE